VIDPFSDAADPLRLDGSHPPELEREPQESPRPKLEIGRRNVVLALALLPTALAVSGCAHLTPACPTQPADSHHCRHRFCRYSALDYSG
jgi:hypothetical protein